MLASTRAYTRHIVTYANCSSPHRGFPALTCSHHLSQVVKFNRVNSLHIFLDREGADKVSVASIKFFGSPVEGVTKDLKDLGKKPEGEA